MGPVAPGVGASRGAGACKSPAGRIERGSEADQGLREVGISARCSVRAVGQALTRREQDLWKYYPLRSALVSIDGDRALVKDRMGASAFLWTRPCR